MGPGRISGTANLCNHIPGLYFLACRHKNLRTVPVFGRKGMPLVSLALNGNAQAISTCFAGKGDRSVMPGKDFRTLGHANINAGMVILFLADRMYPVAVVAGNIGQPVRAKYIFHILAVAFGLQ